MTVLDRERLERSMAGGRREHGRARGLDPSTYTRALRSYWRSLVVCVLIGVGIAGTLSLLATPMYESKSTFFAATSTPTADNQQALQADQFAQSRINSYVGVIESDRIARIVKSKTFVPMSTTDLAAEIHASVAPATVLLTVRVVDKSPARAQRISQALAQNLDKAVSEIDTRDTGTDVRLNLISGPRLTPGPISPRTKLNLAIGLLLGVAIGVGQAILRRQLDSTFRSDDELASAIGYPSLGVTYYHKRQRRKSTITPHEHRSREAESFRHLRTNLRFLQATSPVSLIVVTSTNEDEGKTSTSANLALALAALKRKVLLVDGDLRKPGVARALDLEGSVGLTNVLVDEIDLDEITQSWGTDGLKVLTSGPLPPNPSELLGSDAMEQLLKRMRKEYDVVVIDTPPLLPVTDAAVLAAQADGTILAVKYASTREDKLGHAIDALQRVDARILGTVLTMSREAVQRQPTYYADRKSPDRRPTERKTAAASGEKKHAADRSDAQRSERETAERAQG